MPTKRFIVLANSAKNGQHCIAGKEVLVQGGTLVYGSWIRPVSAHGDEGAVSTVQCALGGRHDPAIWDIIDVPVLRPEGYASQPENWIIDDRKAWGKVAMKSPPVPMDTPPNLRPSAHRSGNRTKILYAVP